MPALKKMIKVPKPTEPEMKRSLAAKTKKATKKTAKTAKRKLAASQSGAVRKKPACKKPAASRRRVQFAFSRKLALFGQCSHLPTQRLPAQCESTMTVGSVCSGLGTDHWALEQIGVPFQC